MLRDRAKQRAIKKLKNLYERIPKVDCKRQCNQCCGPVVWSRLEWDRLPEELKKTQTTLTCPYLQFNGKCEVYEYRPLVCRLFAVVERMRCPYVVPEKMLTTEAENEILKEYSAIVGTY
jgi:hypothetical protein